MEWIWTIFFSVIRNHIPDSRKPSTVAPGYDHSPPKGIRCPTCGVRSDIPSGGVTAFPPNYPLQHKMVLATINSRSTHLLCDICTADVSVSFINDIIKLHWTEKEKELSNMCINIDNFVRRCILQLLHTLWNYSSLYDIFSCEILKYWHVHFHSFG